MKGLREIKTRIKAVKSTEQITHAMRLVAASKMRRAQESAEHGRAYAVLLLDLLAKIRHSLGDENCTHPLFAPREEKRRLFIIFSTDKGLCGSLNTNIFKIISTLPKDAIYVCVGSRAAKFVARTGRNLTAQFKISDFVKFSEIKPVASYVLEKFMSGKADTIEIVSSAYVNTLTQEARLFKLAPALNLDAYADYMRSKFKLKVSSVEDETRQILFEPSAGDLLNSLPEYYINNIIYQTALSAKAAEQSARMVAMKNASENAENLIASLTLEYNKARQSAITTQIIELAGALTASES